MQDLPTCMLALEDTEVLSHSEHFRPKMFFRIGKVLAYMPLWKKQWPPGLVAVKDSVASCIGDSRAVEFLKIAQLLCQPWYW